MNQFLKLIAHLKPWLFSYNSFELSKQLYIATENGDLELVKYLLSKGAHVNIKHVEYLSRASFKESEYKETPLHKAVKKNYVELTRLLLDNGADINAKDALDLTPLYIAAINSFSDIENLLISYGADPSITSFDGSSYNRFKLSEQLYLAIKNEDLKLVKSLLDQGANADKFVYR